VPLKRENFDFHSFGLEGNWTLFKQINTRQKCHQRMLRSTGNRVLPWIQNPTSEIYYRLLTGIDNEKYCQVVLYTASNDILIKFVCSDDSNYKWKESETFKKENLQQGNDDSDNSKNELTSNL